jgi:prevent-host-death family protein
LIAEVEATGEEIVITRHGAPAARLVPVAGRLSRAEREAIVSAIAGSRDAWAAAHPQAAVPLSWDEVKAMIDDER